MADGRLHLSAVVLLTPYLTPENADELLAVAAHQDRSQLEPLLAQRFPRPDVPAPSSWRRASGPGNCPRGQ